MNRTFVLSAGRGTQTPPKHLGVRAMGTRKCTCPRSQRKLVKVLEEIRDLLKERNTILVRKLPFAKRRNPLLSEHCASIENGTLERRPSRSLSFGPSRLGSSRKRSPSRSRHLSFRCGFGCGRFPSGRHPLGNPGTNICQSPCAQLPFWCCAFDLGPA